MSRIGKHPIASLAELPPNVRITELTSQDNVMRINTVARTGRVKTYTLNPKDEA